MKIGEFSEKTGLTVQTIRYYVDIGLMQPLKNGHHWDFDATCLARAQQVARYKACGLPLGTIAKMIELENAPGVPAEQRWAAVGQILRAERRRVEGEQAEIKAAIRQIDTITEKMLQGVVIPADNSIPLHLFSLVHCPYCDIPLTWNGVKMRENAVYAGSGWCSCGFSAQVVDGILVAHTDENVLIEVIDDDRQTLRQRSAQDISYVESFNQWILDSLSSHSFAGKIVYEDVINTACLLDMNIPKFSPDTAFILCDTDINVVRHYVASIRAANPHSKLLFMVDDGVHHPIKKGSLDLVLDCASSEIYQRFGYRCIFDILKPYCHDGTLVAGRFSYLFKRKRALQQSKFKNDPRAGYRYQLEAFRQSMEKNGIRLLGERLGTRRLEESVYDGCEPGDIMKPYAFMGCWRMR